MFQKKPSLKYFFFSEIFVFGFFGIFAHAQFGYQLLAPIPGSTENVTTVSSLASYLKILFTMAVGFGIVASVFMIVIGGIQYITAAATNSKEDGKKKIQDAVIGLLLVLSSWVILYTLNPKLLNSGLNLPEVTVTVENDADSVNASTVTQYCLSTATGVCYDTLEKCTNRPAYPNQTCEAKFSSTTGPESGTPQDASVNAAKLKAAGISLKGNASVAGVRDTTINQVVALQQGCNCNITVSSGTDGVHASGQYSHANGYKLDLRLDPNLNTYIQSISTNIGTRSDGAAIWQDKNNPNVTYNLESTHWDVSVK